MLKEFKEFAFGGSLVESAVAFVMALAAAALIGSLVEHVITPIIAAIFGQPDFASLRLDIGDSAIAYGAFLNALITFTSVALAVYFFIVKPYKAYKAKTSGPEAEAAPPEDIALLREIRDGLARR
jgi:large conductance mechanosensitive channel